MSASGTSPITLVAKTCLVTGGAGGLGKAIAAEFLRAGANVVICDIHEQRVQAASAELSAMGPLLALSLDITNATAVEDMFDQIRTRFGTIHVLVNNAAIMDRFDPVAEVEPQLWDRILAVNLTAPFLLTKLALQVMLQQENRDASIINIASGAAKAGWLAVMERYKPALTTAIRWVVPIPGAAYTASKHGLMGLTKSTASYYGPKGIRCNCLMIGILANTHINDAYGANGCHVEGRKMVMDILTGLRPRPCRTEDVAALCLALTQGPGSSLLNGSCINVDYGWTSVVG